MEAKLSTTPWSEHRQGSIAGGVTTSIFESRGWIDGVPAVYIIDTNPNEIP